MYDFSATILLLVDVSATAPDLARRTLSTLAFHSAERYSASTWARVFRALTTEPL
jgi:hypothetical protein